MFDGEFTFATCTEGNAYPGVKKTSKPFQLRGGGGVPISVASGSLLRGMRSNNQMQIAMGCCCSTFKVCNLNLPAIMVTGIYTRKDGIASFIRLVYT